MTIRYSKRYRPVYTDSVKGEEWEMPASCNGAHHDAIPWYDTWKESARCNTCENFWNRVDESK